MESITPPLEGGRRADGRHGRKHFKADRATKANGSLEMLKMYLSGVTLKLPYD